MTAPMDPTFGQFVAPGQEAMPPEPSAIAGEPEAPSDLDLANERIAAQDQTIRDLATRPAPAAPATPTVADIPPLAPLGPMPDPTTDPSGFAQWTASKDQRNTMDIQRQITETRDQALQLVAARDITNSFIAQHPEYAAMASEVQTELGNAVNELGLKSLPEDPSELHRVAAKAMGKRAEKWVATRAEGSEHSQRSKGRVEGTAGASTSAAGVPKKEAERKPISMVEAIKQQQLESGFF